MNVSEVIWFVIENPNHTPIFDPEDPEDILTVENWLVQGSFGSKCQDPFYHIFKEQTIFFL